MQLKQQVHRCLPEVVKLMPLLKLLRSAFRQLMALRLVLKQIVDQGICCPYGQCICDLIPAHHERKEDLISSLESDDRDAYDCHDSKPHA